jgi:hypothetical protein
MKNIKKYEIGGSGETFLVKRPACPVRFYVVGTGLAHQDKVETPGRDVAAPSWRQQAMEQPGDNY